MNSVLETFVGVISPQQAANVTEGHWFPFLKN